jgi:SH3-like domain-containing protein
VTSFRKLRRIAGLALAAGLAWALSPAAAKDDEALPVPRYVSIGTDRANVRTGPGERYPIDWVFVKKGVPVEVTAEYENWRKIKDLDGAEGWIYKGLLSPRRYAVVIGSQRAVYVQPDSAARTVYFAGPGVTGRLDRCQKTWCELTVDGNTGWIPKTEIWGVLADEEFE